MWWGLSSQYITCHKIHCCHTMLISVWVTQHIFWIHRMRLTRLSPAMCDWNRFVNFLLCCRVWRRRKVFLYSHFWHWQKGQTQSNIILHWLCFDKNSSFNSLVGDFCQIPRILYYFIFYTITSSSIVQKRQINQKNLNSNYYMLSAWRNTMLAQSSWYSSTTLQILVSIWFFWRVGI